MKTNNINMTRTLVLFLGIIFLLFTQTNIYAQKTPKKARIKVKYTNNNGLNLLQVSAKYKEKRKYRPAKGLDIKVYSVLKNDSLAFLGNGILGKKGTATFNVNSVFKNNRATYTFKVIHKTSKNFKKASKSVSISVAHIKAELKTIDKVPTIFATLTDADNKPIEGAELKVNLQRYFAPLAVGKAGYFTDEEGTISVPITRKMPGLKGKLNYEVVLEDSDDYGNIITVVNTNLGTQIKDLSTFDQRTMWSPPNKTPLFNLIILNLLIFGTWGYLFILIFNLYRISKHKQA
jgi:hypothetical protein